MTNQGSNAISIGNLAGNHTQKYQAIAIGDQAGQTQQGTGSIAIGYGAGQTNQAANSIVINASGLWSADTAYQTTSGFFVRPVRGDTPATPVVTYNTDTFELTYSTSSIKYKKNVIDLTEDTSVLHNIKAREYDSKESNKHFIGYIAEELNDASPWFTWKNPDGSPEGIEWFNLLVYSIEEIKKLKNQIVTLTERIQVLENN